MSFHPQHGQTPTKAAPFIKRQTTVFEPSFSVSRHLKSGDEQSLNVRMHTLKRRNDLNDGGRGLIWPQTRNAASVMSDVDAVRVFTRCCFPASSTITRHRHTSQTRPTTRPLQASTLLRNNHSAHLKCVGQAPERCGSGSESRRTPSLTPESPLHSHHPRKHRVQSEEHSDVCR